MSISDPSAALCSKFTLETVLSMLRTVHGMENWDQINGESMTMRLVRPFSRIVLVSTVKPTHCSSTRSSFRSA